VRVKSSAGETWSYVLKRREGEAEKRRTELRLFKIWKGNPSRLSSFSTHANVWIARLSNRRIDQGQWATLEYAHVLASSHVPSDGSQARLRSATCLPLAGGTAMKRNRRESTSIRCSERLFRQFNLDHVSWGLTVATCTGSIASVTAPNACFVELLHVSGSSKPRIAA
jgi:hypothetical protein